MVISFAVSCGRQYSLRSALGDGLEYWRSGGTCRRLLNGVCRPTIHQRGQIAARSASASAAASAAATRRMNSCQGKPARELLGLPRPSVAEEAAVTAEIMGNRVERIADVGVSGLHR